MITTNYRVRKLAPMLDDGRAWVVGRMRPAPTTSDGECYIIDTVEHETWHVPVVDRLSWSRHEGPEES